LSHPIIDLLPQYANIRHIHGHSYTLQIQAAHTYLDQLEVVQLERHLHRLWPLLEFPKDIEAALLQGRVVRLWYKRHTAVEVQAHLDPRIQHTNQCQKMCR
jgi:hypothetical protein